MIFQDAIKELRIESGLSQRELGEKFHVERATVSRWEAGSFYPKQKVSERILCVVNTMDVSDKCKRNVKQALQEGRRLISTAKGIGAGDIDQELINKIVDESTNAVYAIEVDTYKILYANKKTEKIAQFDSDDVKNKTCYEYMMNRNTPCENCPLKSITGYEFSEQVIMHQDNKRYLRIRGRKMKWNGKDIFITYVSNVTDLVHEKKAKQRFLDLMPTGAGTYRVYFDGRLELMYMNEGFYKMFGMNREESKLQTGFTDLSLVHPDDVDQLKSLMSEVLKNPDHIYDEEHRIDIGDGKYRKIILRGVVAEKTAEYYTFYCSFINLDESGVFKWTPDRSN